MKRFFCMVMALCLMLCGCGSWMDGSHISVTPHEEQVSAVQAGTVSASNYMELRGVLERLISTGAENAVINVAEYDQEAVEEGIIAAAQYLTQVFPLGTYAIDSLTYEIGSSGGQPAVSVSISYIHGRSEIRQIREAADMTKAQELIQEELQECGEGIVLLIAAYEEMDIPQMVEDFALLNPNAVMETPQVAVGVYPETGSSRVVELKFTYQTSRDSLRQMQTQVQRVFTSAAFYVNSDAAEAQKYSQLYTFLMERFDYKIETSITPAYSLLSHGVGDSRAFASVYAAMCRQAGLECMIVTGTKDGMPRSWNLIREGDTWYHVDLLGSSAAGQFQKLTDENMQGYVWDYSAYPAA